MSRTRAVIDEIAEDFDADAFFSMSEEKRIDAAMAEQDRIARLFNSADVGFGHRETSGAMQPLLCQRLKGALKLKVIDLPKEVAIPFDPARFLGGGGGGPVHEWLQEVARLWLLSLAQGEVRTEARLFGGRIDVYCDDPTIAVEVGSTGYSRAIDVLIGAPDDRFILLPFPAYGRRNEPIRCVELVLDPRGRDELYESVAVTRVQFATARR